MPHAISLKTLVITKGLAPDEPTAERMILAGEILLNGQIMDKPGMLIAAETQLSLKPKMPYVGRGGLKLQHALETFKIDVTDMTAADVGASTGGFTHCLLKQGAERVYAIDVGRGQLDEKLRKNPRVVNMEKTNARELSALPECVNLVTIDVSFISLKTILPVIIRWMKPNGMIITLIKPQFESPRKLVPKGGVIEDSALRERIVQKVVENAEALGLQCLGLTPSPIKGHDGNEEWLAYFQKIPTE
jgi:23S rRNA (cytidine1920-2'-O)/16S rRNA (cytidine1409-2'-O)-methyltransferase